MTAAQKQLTNATDSNWTCVSQGRALTLLLLFLPPFSLAAAAAVCYYDDEIQLGSPPVQLRLLLSNQLCVRWMGVWRCFYSRSGATGRVSEFRIQKKNSRARRRAVWTTRLGFLRRSAAAAAIDMNLSRRRRNTVNPWGLFLSFQLVLSTRSAMCDATVSFLAF